MLDIRQGQMFTFNRAGSQILELLEAGKTEAAIVEEIRRQFGVSREVAESDLREFIELLEKHQLLEACESIGLQ